LNGNGQKTIAVKANVGDKTEVDEMVKTTIKAFGKVDILVNNAGMSVGRENSSPQYHPVKLFNH
jgi:3-oxoacyl-[acyl-carrier protein] reductase